jgi:hypothetical protein
MAQSLNPTFKKLTAIDIVNVSDLFKQHLTVTPDGAVYADGWDDDRVAKEAIPNYTGNARAAVGKYRITLGYGLLATISKKTVSSEYEELNGMIHLLHTKSKERFEEIEDQIYRLTAALEDRYDEFQKRILMLERSHFAIASAESQLRRMNNG